MKHLITPTNGRLRFRYELLHAQGVEASWPDASHGQVEAVVVAPYDFWPEALVIQRDGRRVRVPTVEASAIEPGRRVLIGARHPHRAGLPPRPRLATVTPHPTGSAHTIASR